MKDTGDALGRKLNTTKARHSHEVRDEALTGEPAGQPLSRESFILVQGADAVSVAEDTVTLRPSSQTSSWCE
jgi:hypothetical protein